MSKKQREKIWVEVRDDLDILTIKRIVAKYGEEVLYCYDNYVVLEIPETMTDEKLHELVDELQQA